MFSGTSVGGMRVLRGVNGRVICVFGIVTWEHVRASGCLLGR